MMQDIHFDHTSPAIACERLSYSYDGKTRALHEITLEISGGEKIGIIGPNGAGKSTFLTLLNGLRSGEGSISVFGVKITPKSSRLIKSAVGLVFQNPDDQLFCPSVYEDVAFGPLNLGLSRESVNSRVENALDEVGLNGYEERFALHLSYGERKLVAIATILSMQPEIIAMDEPTSNLDPAHRRKIINWIRRSKQTLVITSHDLDMVLETCGRIYIFNQGHLRVSGDTVKILTDKALLERHDLELPLRLQKVVLQGNQSGNRVKA